jgi:hypothetical protein
VICAMGNGRAIADREQSHEFQVRATQRSHVKQTLVVNRRVLGASSGPGVPNPKAQAPNPKGDLPAAPCAIAVTRVVSRAEPGAVIVPIRVARSVRSIEALVARTIVAMADWIVSPAIETIVLRMPEAVCIAARVRRFLVTAPQRGRVAQPSPSATLRVSRQRGQNECESDDKRNEATHGMDPRQTHA